VFILLPVGFVLAVTVRAAQIILREQADLSLREALWETYQVIVLGRRPLL